MDTLRRNDHASVVMLLSLIAALNASQAMVLCVGADGHVAVERAGHDHCADGTHLCESDAAVHDTRLVPGMGGTRCGGCTDISMAETIGSDPGVSAASKIIAAGMLAASSQVYTPPDPAAARAKVEFQISHFDLLQGLPLSSIVLRV